MTSSKPQLYCAQTFCNYYSSCISLLKTTYTDKKLSIALKKFTLETNSLEKNQRCLGLATRSFLGYKIYIEIFLFKLHFTCLDLSLHKLQWLLYLLKWIFIIVFYDYYIILLLYFVASFSWYYMYYSS